MGCLECGETDAKPSRIEYVDGTTEHVSLCQKCLREFEEGDLIAEVSQEDARTA